MPSPGTLPHSWNFTQHTPVPPQSGGLLSPPPPQAPVPPHDLQAAEPFLGAGEQFTPGASPGPSHKQPQLLVLPQAPSVPPGDEGEGLGRWGLWRELGVVRRLWGLRGREDGGDTHDEELQCGSRES